jgi:hypothetical protein
MDEQTNTCFLFHKAKSETEADLHEFKTAAEKDGRDMKDEVLDLLTDVFGSDFVNDITGGHPI